MPNVLHLPPVAQGVIAISAVALAILRLLTASRPFWAWEKVPVWVQKLLPALLMAVAALPTALEHARSWLDVVVAFVVTGAMWFTASRGDKRPPEDKSGGPRIDRVNSDPKLTRDELESEPPSLPGVRLSSLVAIGLMILTLSCSAATQLSDPCSKVSLATVTAGCEARIERECEPGDTTCAVYVECSRAVQEWRLCK